MSHDSLSALIRGSKETCRVC
uniref:Macaca fascicularis brain cDNA clone: QorA-10486, similar to human vacuolar protein sorting 45A (yeast) (VPS45A), mRNA, RefSeq: NM_007259.2 n=1 Tax=Macaca fascicularis TaxID=9541 RepID=I7GL22_MACFA|nr:unnamed protein product [Macaca fascicularis]